jgi:hypothetical protein
MSIAQEHKMVKKDGFTFTMAVYFASRWSILVEGLCLLAQS